MELETAKIATELESIASGVVAHILVPEGATCPSARCWPLLLRQGAGGSVSWRSALWHCGSCPSARCVVAQCCAGSSQVVPAARRLAQERGIDLAQIQGTGPGGRILVEDVQKALRPALPPPAPAEVAVQVTPAARHLARQHGIDLRRVQVMPQGQNSD